jgi:hypothetical protein
MPWLRHRRLRQQWKFDPDAAGTSIKIRGTGEVRGRASPIEAALAVSSREELVAYLEGLAENSRAGIMPVENPNTSDFIDASAAWLEGLDPFLREHTGEGAPASPSWAIVAMVFSAGLVYE